MLVTRSDPVTGAEVTTAEQTMPLMELTGSRGRRPRGATWSASGGRGCGRRCCACSSASPATARTMERAARRQCKKDQRETESLITEANDWKAHVFDPKSVELVTRSHSQGRDAAVAGVLAYRDSLEQAAGAVCGAVGAARSAQGGGVHGGARGRELHLYARRGGRVTRDSA